MTYAVTIELAPPAGTNPLDRLQAELVATMLDRFLSQATEAVTTGGAHITVTDRWVGTHPDGAIVMLMVNAPTPDDATTAVTALVAYGLDSIDALTGWAITKTEIGRNGPAPAPVQASDRRRRAPARSRRRGPRSR